MREMSQPPEKLTLRYQLGAIARDVLTIVAVIGLLTTGLGFITRPYTQPFLKLPTELAQLQLQLAKVQVDLSEVRDPRLVEFNGHAIVINDDRIYVPGSSLRLLYNLRRNASCATELEVGFFNVTDGTRIISGTRRAVQAPVTEDFQPFLLRLRIPPDLPDGVWSYQPRIIPIDCGIYGSYLGALSEPFRVFKSGEAP